MRKVVEGSYPTLQDALMAVERLRDAGHEKGEIFLVANQRIRQQIASRADVQLESANMIDSETETESRSLWDRVHEAFTVDNYDPGVYTREDRIKDENPLRGYQEEIRKGNILVLLHQTESSEKSAGHDRNESQGNRSEGTAAGKRTSDYVGVDSQTPRTINSAGGMPRSNEAGNLADPEKSLDVDVEGMKQEYEQQRQWSEKSLRDEKDSPLGR